MAPPELRAMRRRTSLALLCAALAGCAAAPQCPAGSQAALLDQLYFGTARAQGATVSEAEWSTFAGEEIAPRFPQGYTLLEAQGQWRGADGAVVAEHSHVLQVAHPADAASAAALRDIADRYKARFAQEAVLQVGTPACMRF
jgi:hypothetical protein